VSGQEAAQLLAEIGKYRIRARPYSVTLASGDLDSLREYWENLRITKSDVPLQLPLLALIIHDIKPHAADPEKTFSLMGFFHTARRNQLLSVMLAMLQQGTQMVLNCKELELAEAYSLSKWQPDVGSAMDACHHGVGLSLYALFASNIPMRCLLSKISVYVCVASTLESLQVQRWASYHLRKACVDIQMAQVA